MKRILVLIIAISLAMSISCTLAASAEEVMELVKNGNFEAGKSGWMFQNGGSIEEKFGKDDSKGLKFVLEDGNAYAMAPLRNILGGNDYTLSIDLKVVSQTGTGAAVKFEFLKEANTENYSGSVPTENFTPSKPGVWETFTRTIAVPETTTAGYILIRWFDAGEAYYDNISFTAPLKLYTPNNVDVPLPPKADGATELLKNGDMEDGKTSWDAYKTWDAGFATVTTEKAHSGKTSMKISTITGGNPWIKQSTPIVPNTDYVVSSYINRYGVSGNVAYKYEFYDAEGMYMSVRNTRNSNYMEECYDGLWSQFTRTITAPKGAASLSIYVRLYGDGTMYVDDVTCYAISETKPACLETDEIFYYTEWGGNCIATVDVDEAFFPELADASIIFELLDDKMIIDSKEIPLTSFHATYAFPLSLLTQTKKEYTVRATPKTADGTRLVSSTKPVYRYDRPKRINDKKQLIVDGKPFVPVIMYHVVLSDLSYQCDDTLDMGANTMITWIGHPERPSAELIKVLDTLDEHGLKALVSLYGNMKAAGSVENTEHTKKTVAAVKDHPAVIGYVVMDEPAGQLQDSYESDLMNSYRIIHDIDDVNPIYMVEAPEYAFKTTGQCADILGHDPYPGNNIAKLSPATCVSNQMAMAIDAVNSRKPVYSILQAFDYFGMSGRYFPTVDELRHMWYQALIVGVDGTGYYSLVDAAKDDNGQNINLKDTHLGPGIATFKAFEQGEITDRFINKKYPAFSEYRGDDYWYSAWVHDKDVYMVVLNRDASPEKTADVPIEIPLTSTNGRVKISDYTAEIVAGGEGSVSGSGILNHNLKWREAALYKITPTEKIDTASLTQSAFDDIDTYDWAKDAIDALWKKGIVNQTGEAAYSPGVNITRADFAMFLVRTLGLKGTKTENFADVDESAYYAKELAAGKELGILKGVGDNKFNPDAEISRQDLMTIIARGMKLTGASDLSVFSDSDTVSDYALESVHAMIASGLIKGNADGTLNPLGKATRAEAAVIMHRIINK